ncbi:O-antigen/teichoic acid export membrane protein [Streptomyces puniciscabiei]|uniref:O-antigen/teichoic acid export membrane protein n=1 Tax=Streptomyces puniciscabiei TaxID=164348 RepID=A0A542UIL8_9ACTN|nr:oligosaccharide flippase family protein [Streptomyces puniciscabiei]TQK98935.1 O-antigen/teichoic acid export membrane protein [Streptomyces puniciscabiei]
MTAPGAAPPATTGAPARSTVAAAARGGFWGAMGSATNAVFAFLLVGLITRAVGAQGAGAIFTGVAVFTIASNVCKLGADTGLVRFLPGDLALNGGRSVGSLLRMAVLPAVAAATATAAVLLYPGVATTLLPHLPRADALALIRFFGLVLPAATVSLVLLGATQGYGTVVPFVSVEQIGKPVLRVLIAVPVAYWAPGLLSLAAAWLLPALAGLLAAWLGLRRCRTPRSTAAPVGDPAVSWREFWAFAAPRAVSSVFDISAVWVGVILLSALATDAEAGIYTAIGRVVTAGTLLQLAVRLAVAPQLSRLLAVGETAEAQHLHRVSTCWIVLFSWPLFVLIAGFPRTVLAVFGPEFTQGAPALVVLCAAAVVNVAVGNAQTVLLMAGKSTWHLACTAAAFAVQLTVGLLAVPRWGILGAAVSWGAAVVVENLSAALLVGLRLGFTTVAAGYTRALGVAAAVSVVLAGVRTLSGDTPSGLAYSLTIGMFVFGTFLWRYRTPLGVSELAQVLRRRTA